MQMYKGLFYISACMFSGKLPQATCEIYLSIDLAKDNDILFIELTVKDIPGCEITNIDKATKKELKFWLSCRGLKFKYSETNAELLSRSKNKLFTKYYLMKFIPCPYTEYKTEIKPIVYVLTYRNATQRRRCQNVQHVV